MAGSNSCWRASRALVEVERERCEKGKRFGEWRARTHPGTLKPSALPLDQLSAEEGAGKGNVMLAGQIPTLAHFTHDLKRPKVMKPMAVASGTVVYFERDPERDPQPKSGPDSAKE